MISILHMPFFATLVVELKNYGRSLFLYIVLALACFSSGLLFYSYVVGPTPRYTSDIVYAFYYAESGLTILLAVILSVRLLSEDFSNKMVIHYQLAYAPLRAIIWGKFAAAFLILTLFHALTSLFPLYVLIAGNESFSSIFTGFMILSLIASCIIAISLFFSCFTHSQWIASILAATFIGVLLTIWMLAQVVDEPFKSIFNFLAIHHMHFSRMGRGIMTFKDIIFYLSLCLSFIELTNQILNYKLRRRLGA